MPSAPAAKPADASDAPLVTIEKPKRLPLLREGSFLTRAAGAMRLDKERNEWVFVAATRDPSGLERTLVLLPNEALADASRTARLAPTPIDFELTGETFIYHGQNYVLASLLSPIVRSAPPPPPTPAPSGDKGTASPATPLDEEKIAAELERKLAERVSAMPKAVIMPEGENSAAAGDGAGSAPPPPETRVQDRRGHLVRDSSTGGWRFVFDGQLAKGGDPSMPVLPCLALERVEAATRESESQMALVVAGAVTRFEGRAYLLPTSFRIARGGRGINP